MSDTTQCAWCHELADSSVGTCRDPIHHEPNSALRCGTDGCQRRAGRCGHAPERRSTDGRTPPATDAAARRVVAENAQLLADELEAILGSRHAHECAGWDCSRCEEFDNALRDLLASRRSPGAAPRKITDEDVDRAVRSHDFFDPEVDRAERLMRRILEDYEAARVPGEREATQDARRLDWYEKGDNSDKVFWGQISGRWCTTERDYRGTPKSHASLRAAIDDAMQRDAAIAGSETDDELWTAPEKCANCGKALGPLTAAEPFKLACGPTTGCGYENDAVRVTGRIPAGLRSPSATESDPKILVCPKVPHDLPEGGYLHDENDDRPYDVDGVAYCGRCHVALSSGYHHA